jgi:hypothetical protein
LRMRRQLATEGDPWGAVLSFRDIALEQTEAA